MAACYNVEWPLLIVCPSSVTITWLEALYTWLSPKVLPGEHSIHVISSSKVCDALTHWSYQWMCDCCGAASAWTARDAPRLVMHDLMRQVPQDTPVQSSPSPCHLQSALHLCVTPLAAYAPDLHR